MYFVFRAFFGLFVVYVSQSYIKITKLKSFVVAFLIFFTFSPFAYAYISITKTDKRTDYQGKKIAKIINLGFPKRSQNRPKIHSKSMFPKTFDSSSNFARKMLCCNSANIDFVWVFPILLACRALFFESLFECILGPTNLPKTNLKRRPNPLKIDVKNVSFFNIVFFGFRPRFQRVLGLQDGAKLAQNGVFQFTRCFFCTFSKTASRRTPDSILEPPGLDFGGSGR